VLKNKSTEIPRVRLPKELQRTRGIKDPDPTLEVAPESIIKINMVSAWNFPRLILNVVDALLVTRYNPMIWVMGKDGKLCVF
jgi:hypothetical protein